MRPESVWGFAKARIRRQPAIFEGGVLMDEQERPGNVQYITWSPSSIGESGGVAMLNFLDVPSTEN